MNEFEKPKNEFKLQNSKKIILISLIILIIGLVIGGYIIYQSNINNKEKKNENNSSSSKIIDGQISSTKKEEKEYKVATWNNKSYKPKKHFFSANSDPEYYEYFLKEEYVEYYNVATLTNGDTVVRVIFMDVDDYVYRTFIVDKNDQITSIKDFYNDSFSDSNLSPEIKIDKSIFIPEIYPNADIIYNNITFFADHPTPIENYDFDNNIINKLASNEYGDLFMSKNLIKGDQDDDMYSLQFYFKTPDNNIIIPYKNKNSIINDDNKLAASFINPKNITINWLTPFTGCDIDFRNSEGVFLENFNPANNIKIASTINGNKPIYKLTDEKMIKIFHEEYYYEDSEFSNLSYEDYKKALTHIVYESLPGQWQLLVNANYVAEAGCAKPVIYLYPKKDTYVDVEVGAEITISDPQYPIGGWKHVFAKTDGSLTYNGNNYESLFWEGLGKGKYPIKGRVGKLVTQEKLIPSIKKDLLDQGLNKKEIADFLEFWKDNLPKSPYIRLTWLNTKEMNNLAPLKIYPRPQTMIRVFLEAKGYDRPIELEPQVLTKVARKGFTVVEWGGLLPK